MESHIETNMAHEMEHEMEHGRRWGLVGPAGYLELTYSVSPLAPLSPEIIGLERATQEFGVYRVCRV